jgi:hypothetical protein
MNQPINEVEQEEIIIKLTKDLKAAVVRLTPNEVRFLVDYYYQSQEQRIRCGGQIRSMAPQIEEPQPGQDPVIVKSGEPHEVLSWLEDKTSKVEQQIKVALDIYSNSNEVGLWSRSIVGIGPVIASGLLAHIDITKAPTVGHIWRFAGLDPTLKWEKGQKRPWNASLKTLCWKIGESFVKVSGHKNDIYGKIYLSRKAIEFQKNDSGDYKEQAAIGAARVGKSKEAWKHYSVGKLPPGHLHSRAKRYAVKLFLAHWHETAYRAHFKAEPPLPYAIAILGHTHKINCS